MEDKQELESGLQGASLTQHGRGSSEGGGPEPHPATPRYTPLHPALCLRLGGPPGALHSSPSRFLPWKIRPAITALLADAATVSAEALQTETPSAHLSAQLLFLVLQKFPRPGAGGGGGM